MSKELHAKIASLVATYRPKTGVPSPNDIADSIMALIVARDARIIEKLDNKKNTSGTFINPIENSLNKGYNQAIDTAIAIVRGES